jgi:hypothetical protein
VVFIAITAFLFDSNWSAPWWAKLLISSVLTVVLVNILARFERTVRVLRYVVYIGGAILSIIFFIGAFMYMRDH